MPRGQSAQQVGLVVSSFAMHIAPFSPIDLGSVSGQHVCFDQQRCSFDEKVDVEDASLLCQTMRLL